MSGGRVAWLGKLRVTGHTWRGMRVGKPPIVVALVAKDSLLGVQIFILGWPIPAFDGIDVKHWFWTSHWWWIDDFFFFFFFYKQACQNRPKIILLLGDQIQKSYEYSKERSSSKLKQEKKISLIVLEHVLIHCLADMCERKKSTAKY